MIMGRAWAFAIVALAGCRTIHDDLAELRAEIVDLEREVPDESPLWIAEGPNAFAPFLEDFTPRIPDFIYNHLVAGLSKMGEAAAEGPLRLRECLEAPSEFRGRFWTVRGTIGSFEPQPVGERRVGLEQVYSGVIFTKGHPVLFHVVDKPDLVTVGVDVVEVTGLFVKVIRYRARDGRLVDAPFLIGRRLGKYY